MDERINSLPWIIFVLRNQLFAINTVQVAGIVQLPTLTSVPEAPPEFEGAANIRGIITPVLNLRKLLQMPTVYDENSEAITNFNNVKKLSEAWLNAFKREMLTGAKSEYGDNPLTLTVTKWLKGFRTDNITLSDCKNRILTSFEKMAQIASEARGCNDETGFTAEGMEKLAELEGLSEECVRFASNAAAQIAIGENAMAIMLSESADSQTPALAILVDRVNSVDSIELISGTDSKKSLYSSNYVLGIAHCEKVKGEIVALDIHSILRQADKFDESQKKGE